MQRERNEMDSTMTNLEHLEKYYRKFKLKLIEREHFLDLLNTESIE